MDRVCNDTETTSLAEPWHPEGRRTWEVAIIRDLDDEVSALWLQIIDVDLTHADPEALRIGRFDERFSDEPGPRGVFGELTGAPTAIHRPDGSIIHAPTRWELQGVTEARAAVLIDNFTAGAVLHGSRPEFDAANYADILRRHGRLGATEQPRWYHHCNDVTNQALGWLRAGPDADQWREPSYPTSALSVACGVPVPADRHSAWADATWVRRWDDMLSGGRNDVLPATIAG